LIGIEDLGPSMVLDGIFEGLQAKARLQAVGKAIGKHQTTEPVDYRNEVYKPVWKSNISDVGTPDLQRTPQEQTIQQIGEFDVLWVWLRGVRPRLIACQSKTPHDSLYMLAIDVVPFLSQLVGNLPRAIEWPSRINLVDATHQLQFGFAYGNLLVVVAGT